MDIAKYIGLFLLKNKFCYVHGLGNMELTKRPAMHDGKSLQAPSYEIIVTPGGSIDDNLANFIATNEQISISKAANALREYSIQARKDMAAGKEVPIPNMGNFIEQNGKVKFVTDEKFSYTPTGIPTIRNSKQLEEQNAKLSHKPAYPPPAKPDSVNWSMVILVVVLLIIIGGGIYGIYYYSRQHTSATTTPPMDTVVQEPLVIDTSLTPKDTTALAPPPVDTLAVMPFKIVIGQYNSKERAEGRQQRLAQIGNQVEVVKQDSLSYLIITTVNIRMVDTARVRDSLGVHFGFHQGRVYQQ